NESLNDSGVRTSYDWINYDPATDNKVRGYAVNYNDNGKVTGIVDERYDGNGDFNLAYEYTGYSYDAEGTTTGYIRYTKDQDGNITKSCIWSSVSGWSCS
ncbi:MAG: hypothetical protein ABH872_05440, partial [Candidatus Omnitrophota bacterium]